MPPYSESRERKPSWFVRAGNRICVTTAGDTSISHTELAQQDGIADQVEALRRQDPVQLDAGVVQVKHGVPEIEGESGNIKLPVPSVAREARARTAIVFQALHAGGLVLFKHVGETNWKKFSPKVPRR